MGQPAGSPTAEPVIDLGELTGEGAPEAADGPVRPPRRLALALVAVLVVAGLFGDDARLPLRPVLTTPFTPTDFDLRGDVLYVFDGSYAPNEVSAYRLWDGRRLWRARSPKTTTYTTVRQVGARTLLIPESGSCGADDPVSTVAVDTGSGREVWRHPGTPQPPVSGGGVVLMSRPAASGCGAGSRPGRGYWEAVDAATGAVMWSTELAADVRALFETGEDRGTRWAALVANDGTVTTRDLFTGAVTGQTVLPDLTLPNPRPTLPDPPTEPGPSGVSDEPGPGVPPDVTIAGDHLLVVRHRPVRTGRDVNPTVLDISAYDLVTLAPSWSVRVDLGLSGRSGGSGYHDLSACGPMLCLRGRQWTVYLDPADGAERWRSSLSLLTTAGGWALLADPRVGTEQSPPGALAVRDVRTGRLHGTVPGWRVVTMDVRRGVSPALGVTAGDRTWFARLDVPRLRVVTVGAVPGRYGSCVAEPRYLACRGTGGSVLVWQVPGG
ncbi:PQQ-binding-like beta-propeller repeat protein [Planosporangium sp. 12N6]|uniref:outer membrane protein assembly factor BamB family protein n=1 Tax=Planosporangium spinosum TaxID=3402278 RepID=UPI003CF7E641